MLADSPTDRSLLKEATALFKYSLFIRQVFIVCRKDKQVLWMTKWQNMNFSALTVKKRLKWGVETALENISAFSKNHEQRITAQPSNSTPGYLPPPQNETYAHEKRYIQIFIGTLVIISQTRKQPKCPLAGNETAWFAHHNQGTDLYHYYKERKNYLMLNCMQALRISLWLR